MGGFAGSFNGEHHLPVEVHRPGAWKSLMERESGRLQGASSRLTKTKPGSKDQKNKPGGFIEQIKSWMVRAVSIKLQVAEVEAGVNNFPDALHPCAPPASASSDGTREGKYVFAWNRLLLP